MRLNSMLLVLVVANIGCESRQPKTIAIENKDESSSDSDSSKSKPKTSSANRGARFGQDDDASFGSRQDNNSNAGSSATDPSGSRIDTQAGGGSGSQLGSQSGGSLGAGSTPQNLSDDEVASRTGLATSAIAAGREYLRGQNQEPWDGEQDEAAVNGNWRLQQPNFASVSGSAALPGVSPSPTGLPGLNNPSGLPGLGGQLPNAGAAGATDGGPVTFRIPAGTANRPWNSAANPIVVKLNSSFTIINDDNIVHQLHSGGLSFPHGKEIPPGGSESFTPRSLQVGPTYDHIAGESAQVFIQVVN
jgi:hypothetical protein